MGTRTLSLAAILVAVSPVLAQSTPSPETIIKLAEELASEDKAIQRAASQQLRRLGAKAEPAIPTLIALLQDHKASNTAIQRLIDIGPAAADPLAQILVEGDPSSQAFRLAFTAIRRLGPRAASATPTLGQLTEHETRARRSSAIRLLGTIGEAAFPTLEAGFTANTGQIRLNFARAIGNCAVRSDTALARLCDFAASDSKELRQISATYLRPLRKPRHQKRDDFLLATWIRELGAGAKTESGMSRALVGLESLGTNALRSASKALIKTLDEDTEALRIHAASLLARTGPSILPLLEASFKDAAVKQREWITICAGYTGESAIPFLSLRLESKTEAIRWRAANALQRLGQQSLPCLRTALRSDSPPTVVSALQALALIGPEAQTTVDAITTLAKHREPTVRAAAEQARTSIQGSRSK